MKEKIKDLLLGLGLLTVGIIAIVTIRTTGQQASISSAAELTYATMPTIYSWILILLVTIYIIKTILAIYKEPLSTKQQTLGDELKESSPEATFLSQKTIMLRTIGTLIFLLSYVQLLEHVNFLILTILFLSVLFFVYGQRSIPKIAAVSICGGIVFYVLFIYILKLPI